MRHSGILALAIGFGLAVVAVQSRAAGPAVTLTLKDHRFSPAEITIPAGQRVQFIVINQDKATEEFDSHELKVEKLITPSGKVSFWIGPVAPGTYSFMGEFHPATARGRVIAAGAR
jgi:plastocyanin